MTFEEIKKHLTNGICAFFLSACILFSIVGIVKSCDKVNEIPSSPVEDIRIDSIIHENETLIIEINNLDSIKDVKTIEVKSLDNDSTLKLFYKLIRK